MATQKYKENEMNKEKYASTATALVRGLAAAMLLLLTGGGAYALEDLPLVNTQTVSLAEVAVLSINYSDDDVILREGEGEDLVIREYMKKNRARYYARISRAGSMEGPKVSVRQGRRPWFTWFWEARAEIYLPRSFRGDLALINHSGRLSGETDLLDYKTIDIGVSSGSVYLKRLSGETLSVRVSSGNLDITEITGSFLGSVSSGNLQMGDLTGPEHRIKVSSGRIRIGSVQGDANIAVSSGNIAIERVRGRLETHIASGSISVGNFSGQGSFELSSGDLTLEVAELTGDLRFGLSSGNAELSLPRDIAFNLDAVTKSGETRVDDGDEDLRVSGNSTVLRPFGPAPERTIFARLSSGTLSIRRR
jgi:DUF4097 and DUF4098 domain-containing protein YvlB